MAVDFDNLLHGAGLEEGGRDALFYTKDYTIAGRYLCIVSHLVGVRRKDTSRGGVARTPIAVEPSLMASREYSTWKRRPSGEKVLRRGELWGC